MTEWLNSLLHDLLFLPPQASTMARAVDTLHYTVILGTMLGAVLVGVVAVVFLIRYRAGDRPFTTTPEIHMPWRLELLLVAGTLGLFLLWWVVGFFQFVRLVTPPDGAMVVYVSAKQWMWHFDYPGGARSIALLYVPAGRPVKLVMTSRDVIHSFFVPDFRVKQDVVPGHTTVTWFEAPRPGAHEILCAEYCGTGHSTMRGQVVVLAPEVYAAWLGGAEPATPPPLPPDDPFVAVGQREPRRPTRMVEEGARAAAVYGCLRCHTLDGSTHIGPTWVGLFGKVRHFEGGGTRVADEEYLTTSMMDPAREVVFGFKPVMPSYQGILPPGEAAAIVELIRSLAHGPAGVPVPPAAPIAGVPQGVGP
jgi:cytochrome c oxidase subunit 2